MHLPRKQLILIDGLPAYTFLRPYSWESGFGGWNWGQSRALVCPTCLRVWAKLHMEGSDKFAIYGWPCQSHPTDSSQVAGSIFPDSSPLGFTQDWGLWDNLPKPLLEREFLLTLTHMERYL